MNEFRMGDFEIAVLFYGGLIVLAYLYFVVYAVVNSVITTRAVSRYFMRGRSHYRHPLIVRDPSAFSMLSSAGVLVLIGLVTLYFNLPRH